MTWGCKTENKPDGCGWANWHEYPGMGQREWWCDLCERAGTLAVPARPIEPMRAPDLLIIDDLPLPEVER